MAPVLSRNFAFWEHGQPQDCSAPFARSESHCDGSEHQQN